MTSANDFYTTFSKYFKKKDCILKRISFSYPELKVAQRRDFLTFGPSLPGTPGGPRGPTSP